MIDKLEQYMYRKSLNSKTWDNIFEMYLNWTGWYEYNRDKFYWWRKKHFSKGL